MSDDNKLFKVAGVSAVKGQYKVRFANDMARVKVLIKTDHTDITLENLPQAMTKADAVSFLKTTSLMDKDVYRQAIEAADAKYNSVDKPVVAKVKVTKTAAPVKSKKSAPSIDEIRARAKSSSAPADMLGEAMAALVAESRKETNQV